MGEHSLPVYAPTMAQKDFPPVQRDIDGNPLLMSVFHINNSPKARKRTTIEGVEGTLDDEGEGSRRSVRSRISRHSAGNDIVDLDSTKSNQKSAKHATPPAGLVNAGMLRVRHSTTVTGTHQKAHYGLVNSGSDRRAYPSNKAGYANSNAAILNARLLGVSGGTPTQ